MKLPISLDENQLNSLETYLGRKPTSEDIKRIISQVVPHFPETKPHGGKRDGSGRKKAKGLAPKAKIKNQLQ